MGQIDAAAAAAAMRERERAGYDRVAESYSENSRGQTARRETVLRAADLQRGQAVLDVCTGPGWLAIDAAVRVRPGGSVTGVDLSPRMCVVARTNAQSAGFGAIDFREMNAEQLSLPDTSFDRVLCSLGLMHVPDPARAVAEFARVLRPGGRAVALVWGPPEETFATVLLESLRAAGEPLSVDYGYILRLGHPETLAGLFRRAGFAAVSVEQTGAPTTFAEAGAFWDGFQRIGGLFGSLVEELSPEGRAAARAHFIERAEQYRDSDLIRLPAAQLLAVADR